MKIVKFEKIKYNLVKKEGILKAFVKIIHTIILKEGKVWFTKNLLALFQLLAKKQQIT